MYLKSNCFKTELVKKNFSSIFLKLQVTSLDSQEIVRTTVFQDNFNGSFSFSYIKMF